ncbi:hypothetical protein ACIA8E_37535 [Streptomyces sp. NPDC051664]|uniref:thiolase family protein n=1 Tax=Streptomyces sp. NPDC051664 TaxID=3365668 RepID=UPI00379BE551
MQISCAQQDEFALHSHGKAARARTQGLFNAELAPGRARVTATQLRTPTGVP